MARKVSRTLRIIAYEVWQCALWRDVRPRACYRNGRDICDQFQPGEELYLRWFSDWIDERDALRPAHIAFPDQSVNRSGFGGRCWHVLLPEPAFDKAQTRRRLSQGILKLPASSVPSPITESGQLYSFAVKHDPEEHNFHHCEIRVYRNGQRARDNKSTTKIVKKYYRTKIAEHVKILLRPEVATASAARR